MAEARTFVLAGHETTSNLMTWSLYLLTTHGHVYQKLQNEIDTVLGKETISHHLIKDLKYLDAFFSESLRFYPPAPFLGRYAIKEHTIGKGEKEIKIMKGTEIRFGVYNLHRHPKYWKDPLTFNPDRFLNEEKIHPFSYLPFGGGPRVCIGQNFALMEAKVILASFMQNFTFELVGNQKIVPDVMLTLRPKYGLQLRLSLRK